MGVEGRNGEGEDEVPVVKLCLHLSGSSTVLYHYFAYYAS